MSETEWRALLEAFLAERLSASAFARRFIDAYDTAKRAGLGLPLVIAELQPLVARFRVEVEQRGEDDVDPAPLRAAASRAYAVLERYQDQAQSMAPTGARTYDRARAREDLNRFQIHMTGCAGAGCVVGLVWLALGMLQIYYVSEFIQASFNWGAWPSAVIGFVLAFVPVIGNILAFLGATHSGWNAVLAAIVFFAAPAATIFSGWSRWRRYRR